MNQETFFENFEVLAEAPNGVQKLRELILQLAVQGKLVPQNPDGEPAFFLVEKIKAERKHLVKEGKIKEDKKLTDINDDEIPTDLPKGWVIERFGKIIYVIRGASPRPKGDPKYFSKEKTPYHWIKISDIRKYAEGWILKDTDEFLTEEGAKKSVYLKKGTFILSNSATIGVPTILGINGCIHDGYLAFPHLNENYISIKYFYYFFLHFQGELKRRAFGGAQLNLNTSIVKSIALPLPPREEQKRIVAKVDQLMALCDELEARQQKKHEQRISLNNAALDKLLTAPTPEEFAQHWQRICDNFDLLYDAPETVGLLRQAILQLAVQGKLMAQDEGDEPAAVLLEKITTEKDGLIKEKIIKKSTPLTPVNKDEFLFQIPESWEWVRFGEATINRDGERIPVSKDERNTREKIFDYYGASGVIDKIDNYLFDKPLLLIGEDGANLINRSTPIAFIAKGKYWVNNHAHVLDGISLDFLRYLELYINATDLTPYVTGTAQPKMNQTKMNSIPTAIPPLVEQKRIVAKVDQLIAFCDELEAGLLQAQTDGGKLMEAVVHHVLTA